MSRKLLRAFSVRQTIGYNTPAQRSRFKLITICYISVMCMRELSVGKGCTSARRGNEPAETKPKVALALPSLRAQP